MKIKKKKIKSAPHIKFIALALSVLLILAIFPATVVSASGTATTALPDRRTVRVAFPYRSGMGERNDAGNLTGYNYDYLQTLSEYTGWNIEYITFENMSEDEAILSAIDMVQKGEADLMGTMLKTPDYETLLDFPEENYGVVYTTLATAEGSSITETNYFL